MRLTTRGRSAVNVLIDLALHQEAGPVVLSAISGRLAISVSNLEVIFSKLRSAGIVEATRGPGGGYSLARGADQISVADVVLAVEKPVNARQRQQNCSQRCDETDGGAVSVQELSADLQQIILDYLDSVSLGKLLDDARCAAADREVARCTCQQRLLRQT